MSETRTETRLLECILTPEEKARYNAELTARVLGLEDLKKEKAKVASGYAERIKEAELRRDKLAHALSSGMEYRNIVCEGKNAGGMWTVFRLDTHEIIEQRRPETGAERQLEMEYRVRPGGPFPVQELGTDEEDAGDEEEGNE